MKMRCISRYSGASSPDSYTVSEVSYEPGQVFDVNEADGAFLMRCAPEAFEAVEDEPADVLVEDVGDIPTDVRPAPKGRVRG